MATDNNELQEVLKLMKEMNFKQETLLANKYDLDAKVAKLEAIVFDGNTKATTRTYGYVNWNSHHDILKTKQWKKLLEYIQFCGSLERENSKHFEKPLLKHNLVIDEKTRFPESTVYINIANPLVRAEILHIVYHIRYLDEPATGLVQRFLDVVKQDMHTRSSFEEKYELKWIEPPKN